MTLELTKRQGNNTPTNTMSIHTICPSFLLLESKVYCHSQPNDSKYWTDDRSNLCPLTQPALVDRSPWLGRGGRALTRKGPILLLRVLVRLVDFPGHE